MREVIGRLLRRWGWRASALDYASPGAGVGEDAAPGAVDVVVPVHGAAAAVERCFASLLRHTDLRRHRLVVVVDGDPDFRREALLGPAGGEADVLLLENPARRGFVASVNRGIEASNRDVVLLNSDTVVTRGWLEKLQAAAYSSPEIATVTPFSNNATICSLPRPLVSNALPPGYDVDAFAQRVEEASAREYPRLPAGVGMCLYVKRRVLDLLGPFDQAFGEGYGEEVDFCLRALKAGFRHALDDATFIFHEGQRSFGESRATRVRSAERALARRHPEYVPTIAVFLAADPLRGARRRVTAALELQERPGMAPRVLHVVHGWPPSSHGGTELYAHWLASWQKERGAVAVYARIADPDRRLGEVTEVYDGALRVRLVVNNFNQRDPLARNALRSPLEADFERFMDDFRPDLIHVHHLAGHGLSLLPRAAALGVPIVYQVQDWWALCARANLLPPDRSLCSGPAPGKCSACLPLTRLPPAPLWNRLLYAYRARLARRCFRLADAFVMGSRAIERDYRQAGLLADGDRVHVLPYGVRLPPAAGHRPAPTRSPLRFGYVGTLMPHKGVHVAVEAFAGMESGKAVLEVWGDPSAAPEYTRELQAAAASGPVRLRGTFAEEDKSGIFENLDVLLVPSLGLESFGLVAREAMAHGVPVLASRRGALEELFGADGEACGAFFAPGDVAALTALVERLVERPETLAEWRRRMPPVVGVEEHAAAIERVYAEVMARPGAA